ERANATGGDVSGKEGRLADEIRDEPGRWCAIEVARRTLLHDPAGLHHGDAMGQEERLALIVRDVDRGDAEPPLQLPQLDAHPLAQLRIEVRERLVEEQDLRTAHQRPCEREALLLPPGELRRGAFLEPL